MEHRSQHGLTAGNFPHVDNAKKCRRHVFHEVPVGVLEFSEICSSTVDIDATMTALSCQSADFDWIETKTLIDVRKRLWLYDMQEDKIMR